MNPSKWVFDTIKEAEGLRLKAYICPAGKNTIGYGSAGSDIHPGMVITQEEADELLARDVKVVTDQLNALLVKPVTQGQFDALCDFAFNLGIGALKWSTLLRKLKAGDVTAADEFLKWDKAHVKGKLVALPGLTKRRLKERGHFLS